LVDHFDEDELERYLEELKRRKAEGEPYIRPTLITRG
jgi:hypothetical protein